MQNSVSSELQQFIDDQLASGAYSTPEDVLRAAMAALKQSHQFGDFAPGELDQLIARGERSLDSESPLAAKRVFDEIRQISSDRRKNRP